MKEVRKQSIKQKREAKVKLEKGEGKGYNTEIRGETKWIGMREGEEMKKGTKQSL